MKNDINFPPTFEADKNNLAIDFDGVIHHNSGWGDGTCHGEPIEGSLEALRELSKKHKIVIFTAKAKPDRPLVNGKTGTELVKEWLIKYNISEYVSDITAEKPRAMLYIDDNAYRFYNWKDTLKFVESNL
jgi:hypothetical protein